MSKVFVFRIADNDFVRSELKKGRLRQGWGDSKSSLLELSQDAWVNIKCANDESHSNHKYYISKYRNISKMLDINKGDILIIPKAPCYSQFTICCASGGYSFTEPIGYDDDDYFHTIPVEISSIREFSYHADESCKIIHAKMRAYQSPVNSVWNELIISAAEKLINSDSNIVEQTTEEVVKNIKDDIYKNNAINRFRNLGNRETEKIIKLIFENMGYEFIGSNSYDREGGDADLVFFDNSFSELMEAGINSNEVSGKIFVQIKNKFGVDYDDITGINQLIKRTCDEPGATKILISTADTFTPECISYANKNNILLINGFGFLKLVFKYID